MSGHSKWSTIKHKKAVEDQKRGKIFTKLGKAISLAARDGGDDLSSNFKLRLAVDKAKQLNMPKDNIKRAIEKGAGTAKGASLNEVTYEGYGPGKVAIIIEVVTDNKNRSAAELKSFFDKNGGSMGKPGSVSFLFDRLGLIVVKKTDQIDDQILKLIDLGIEEVEEKSEGIEILVEANKLSEVRAQMEKEKLEVIRAELTYVPKVKIKTSEDQVKKATKFLNLLNDFDDVLNIYTNLDV